MARVFPNLENEHRMTSLVKNLKAASRFRSNGGALSVVTYNTLIQDPVATLERLCKRPLSVTQKSELLLALESDSQGGTSLARDQTPVTVSGPNSFDAFYRSWKQQRIDPDLDMLGLSKELEFK
jgi:hypothetical protein